MICETHNTEMSFDLFNDNKGSMNKYYYCKQCINEPTVTVKTSKIDDIISEIQQLETENANLVKIEITRLLEELKKG